jgi:hypothetical protein
MCSRVSTIVIVFMQRTNNLVSRHSCALVTYVISIVAKKNKTCRPASKGYKHVEVEIFLNIF